MNTDEAVVRLGNELGALRTRIGNLEQQHTRDVNRLTDRLQAHDADIAKLGTSEYNNDRCQCFITVGDKYYRCNYTQYHMDKHYTYAGAVIRWSQPHPVKEEEEHVQG